MSQLLASKNECQILDRLHFAMPENLNLLNFISWDFMKTENRKLKINSEGVLL